MGMSGGRGGVGQNICRESEAGADSRLASRRGWGTSQTQQVLRTTAMPTTHLWKSRTHGAASSSDVIKEPDSDVPSNSAWVARPSRLMASSAVCIRRMSGSNGGANAPRLQQRAVCVPGKNKEPPDLPYAVRACGGFQDEWVRKNNRGNHRGTCCPQLMANPCHYKRARAPLHTDRNHRGTCWVHS